ncbi:MAG: O-antigen ligase family protein [Acidobacteria bacterium]|nr:O-antigen ligase family protein [Acidobacteriota bacterium]
MTIANKTSFVLLCLTLIFSALAYGGVHHPVIILLYVLIAAMALLWAVDGLLTGTMRFSSSLLQIPLYAAFAYAVIQVIPFGSASDVAGVAEMPSTISVDPFSTKLSAVHFLALGAFFSLTLVLLDSAKRIRRLSTVITIFGFGFAFFAILQSVLSPENIYGVYKSPYAAVPFGSFVNRHNFAAYMEMTAALPLGLLFTGAVGRDKRLLYITAIGLMGVALLLSGSRGGLVAFLALVLLTAILTIGAKRKKNVLVRIGLAAALIAAVIGGSFFVGGESSLTRIAETTMSENISADRSNIWAVTLKVIQANMPFGAGFGAFGVAYTPYDNMSGLERVEQAHNDYLQVLADAGLIGLVIGAGFLFVLFQTGRKAVGVENTFRRGIAIGSAAGIFAILVHSLFDFVLHTTAISILFLILMAMLASSRQAYEDDIEDEEDRRSRHRRSRSRSSGTVAAFPQ